MTNNNQLAVNTGAGLSIGGKELFKAIDFAPLNNAIESIAEHSGNLQPDEKKEAKEIVNQWENVVIAELNKQASNTRSFLYFIERTGSSELELEDIGQSLAERTNTMLEFKELMEAKKNLKKLQQRRPEQPHNDLELTYVQRAEKEAAYKVEMAKYDVQESKLGRSVKVKERAWKDLVAENENIIAMVKQARKYLNSVEEYKSDCSNKSQMAKLNIAISSEGVRNSLKELLQFAKTI